MLTVGQPAPDFKLFDSEKNEVSLSQFKGRNVLILFFPLAFTGTCTKELCSIRDDISSYNDANAQVLGISVDSLFVLAKFKAEQNLNFPLLSDFNHEVSALYDTMYEVFINNMRGVSKRSAFVVDKEGILRYVEVLEKSGDLPNFEEIKVTLSGLS